MGDSWQNAPLSFSFCTLNACSCTISLGFHQNMSVKAASFVLEKVFSVSSLWCPLAAHAQLLFIDLDYIFIEFPDGQITILVTYYCLLVSTVSHARSWTRLDRTGNLECCGVLIFTPWGGGGWVSRYRNRDQQPLWTSWERRRDRWGHWWRNLRRRKEGVFWHEAWQD